MDLLKSPLYSKYVESNAKLVDFAGWEMPISFSGLIKEHESVRSSAGLFDISHMGVISIRGINPKDYIQKLFPTNLYSFSEGQGLYTVMLNDKGGIIDDLIIYDLGIQENEISELLLIVNASRYEEDFQWIKNNLNIDKLISKIKHNLKDKFTTNEDILITRERHRQHLIQCVEHLEDFLDKNEKNDFDKAAEDLRLATRHLGMIVGKVDVEEILGSIFNDFCIGK